MGFFKKFGQKAHSLGRFGLKAGKAVTFGAKKVAHGLSKYGKAVSDIATVGASVATALGQPELAVPLVGVAQRASRAAERGQRIRGGIKEVGQAIKDTGLQKPSSKKKKESPFESPAPEPAQPAQPSMVFESAPPRHHSKSKK